MIYSFLIKGAQCLLRMVFLDFILPLRLNLFIVRIILESNVMAVLIF